VFSNRLNNRKEIKMAPFLVAALVAAGLFGTGTIIKPQAPEVGTAMQYAGVGTLVGGAVGAYAGAGSSLATAIGTKTLAATVTTSAVYGASAGATVGTAKAMEKKAK